MANRNINIKDIARLAGVGVSTVSRAINNHPDVNQETRQKIMQVIEEYRYVPNNSARNLKRTNSNTIGVLIKGITNIFYSRSIQIIEQTITAHGASMMLQHVDLESNELDVALELVKEKRLQGLIFLGGKFQQDPAKWAQLDIPFVLCTVTTSEGLHRSKFSSFAIDDEAEAFRAVDYLIRLGHQNIGIIAGLTTDSGVELLRLDGYQRALESHGIPFRPEYVSHVKDFSLQEGYIAETKLLQQAPEITAVFCVSDILAIGCCKAITDSGYQIPQDYSVFGFDGLDLAFFSNPRLTTIRQPDGEMATASIETLFQMIEDPTHFQHHLYPASLIEGQSTAAPRKATHATPTHFIGKDASQ